MKIAAFEGFYGGSHRKWLDDFAKHTEHDVRVFCLPDRFWKWRMHGGAITLARQFNDSDFEPDYLLVTDMVDLNVLLSLTRRRTANIPVVFYFHENQINYPWSDIDRDVKYQRNHHYGFINYASALSADKVLFNSQYHLDAFIGALPRFLKMFPDYQNAATVEEIRLKSSVLSIGVELQAFDVYKNERSHDAHVQETLVGANDVPVVLWNHRWEFDKNPQTFFEVMHDLHHEGLAFQLIICGERTEMYPEIFDEVKETLKDHIMHWGYADDFQQYANLLLKADILPVTSNQDFFGISAVEAMYCDVLPLLPDRLAFPGHIPEEHKAAHLYTDKNDLKERLITLLKEGVPKKPYSDWVERYDWGNIIGDYDAIFKP